MAISKVINGLIACLIWQGKPPQILTDRMEGGIHNIPQHTEFKLVTDLMLWNTPNSIHVTFELGPGNPISRENGPASKRACKIPARLKDTCFPLYFLIPSAWANGDLGGPADTSACGTELRWQSRPFPYRRIKVLQTYRGQLRGFADSCK